jgi:spermidine/putrescine transport system substrate-binding protein
VYDVVVFDSQFIPTLVGDNLLAQIDYRHVPNFKNISANFRNLAYDSDNQHSVPYNWGTTGLLVRGDLVEEPVTRWADLWDPRYAGKIMVSGQPRFLIGLTLKTLGYSANTEDAAELEAALERLLELKPNLAGIDTDLSATASALVSGQTVLAMGYPGDAIQAREENEAVSYVLPEEGTLLWGDTFVVPANSPNKVTAETFLDFLLRPEISAQIVNQNYYANANEASHAFINAEIRNDPVVFPPDEALKNAEIILPLSPEVEEMYDQVWEDFMAASP